MANAISQRTAQEIVEAVKDVCGCDINFIRPDGIIDASTAPERIGTFHEIGHKAAVTGQTLEVFRMTIFPDPNAESICLLRGTAKRSP